MQFMKHKRTDMLHLMNEQGQPKCQGAGAKLANYTTDVTYKEEFCPTCAEDVKEILEPGRRHRISQVKSAAFQDYRKKVKVARQIAD